MPITQLSAPTTVVGDGSAPTLAMLSNGNYVIASGGFDSGFSVIVTEVFDPLGNLIGTGETPLLDDGSANTPQVVGLPGGGYAVAWNNQLRGDVPTAIFDAQGHLVSAGEAMAQASAATIPDSIAALPNGDYV